MMTATSYLELAADAAQKAGAFLREHFESDLVVNESLAYDIKLELDVQTQDLITEHLLGACPGHAIYGEEGMAGDLDSDYEWIVDPIDGTVNYFYGIPHFCVSIALREKGEIIAGVVYDPMQDELFAVEKGKPATRNGNVIHVSERDQLGECVVMCGCSKRQEDMDAGIARFQRISSKVRKNRMLGSAALAMSYVACGRLDAYIEDTISLWDIAAGQLLVEAAGGTVELLPIKGTKDKFSICASSGNIGLKYATL